MVGGGEGDIVIMSITWTSWISLIARNQIVTRGHSLIYSSQALVGSSRASKRWISSPVAYDIIFKSEEEKFFKALKENERRINKGLMDSLP